MMEVLVQKREPGGSVLYADVKQRIREGELKPGDCLPTVRELQDRFDLSYHATRSAMRRLEREGFVLRRQGSGTYVSELPHHVSLRAHTKSIRIVANLHGVMQQAFLRPLIERVQEQLSAMECEQSYTEVLRPREAWEVVRERREDTVVWVCPCLPADIERPEVPVVCVAQDVTIAWPDGAGYDIVTVDNIQGGALAARHFKEVGCENVAILGAKGAETPEVHPLATRRILGFEMEWGRKLPESRVAWANNYTMPEGARTAKMILEMDPRPDGIFTTSDELANGLCHALLAHGAQPGRDMKVVGFDGQAALSGTDPLLTSIAAPMKEMAKAAALLAVQRADNPDGPAQRLNLGCSLRKGDTS